MKKIDELKEYNTKTTGAGGIIMPSIEVFETKTKLAIKLWPQIGNNGEINYLLGKGTGVEIALRGTVKGRKKYNNNFPYRSHSDFEIYGAKTNNYGSLPDSEAFTYVFGPQEIFNRSETKALKKLPEDLMTSTFEEVEYNGEIFLVPELELLFTDKYIARESTPRKEGYDAILLLEEYDLDLDRILYYYDNYFAKVQMQEIEEKRNPEKIYKSTVWAMENNLVSFAMMICDEEGIEMDLDTLNKIANERLELWKDFKPETGFHGIQYKYCPSKLEFEIKDGKYVLTKKCQMECKEKATKEYENELIGLDNKRQEIIDTYNKIQNKKKNKQKR